MVACGEGRQARECYSVAEGDQEVAPTNGPARLPREVTLRALIRPAKSRYATPRACLAAMRPKVAVRPALMPVKLLG